VAELALFCPTWQRPHRLQEVADNIKQNTHSSYTLYWGCERDDLETIKAAKKTGGRVVINAYEPSYANAVQTMYEQSEEPVFFMCNDDFWFPKDWDMRGMKVLHERPDVMVLGVEDGLENTYWTLQFVRRQYIEEQSGVVDMPRRVFYPYHHNFADTEFTQTAMKRGVWDKVAGPCVTHLRLERDKTYEKNDATFATDHGIYLSRTHLFT